MKEFVFIYALAVVLVCVVLAIVYDKLEHKAVCFIIDGILSSVAVFILICIGRIIFEIGAI
jgi:hypothetical protein